MRTRSIVFLTLCLFFVPHLDAKEPLKVYILAGQSNMQGHAQLSTFDHLAMDPRTAPILAEMRTADGTPRICDQVWISSIGNDGTEQEHHGRLTAGYGAMGREPKIGPELTFGIYMQKQLDEPILLIKTAWGGKSLHTDFRPPSAGPYEFNESQLASMQKQGKDIDQIKRDRAEATGRYYRLMIDHVNKVVGDIQRVYPDYDSQAGYEIAGFVWFQGWNDMVARDVYPNRDKPGGYDLYSRLLADFIRDVRKDLSAPEMPFVIGVMGVGGPVDKYGPSQQRYKSTHDGFRKAMAAPAAMPEFQGNVAAVLTENYWDAELDELKSRGGKIKAKSQELNKDPSLSRQQREQALAKFREELYSPRELEILKGSSNAQYHYNGSAKIMAQIGKGFAEAMAKLSKSGTE
ncbi:sialate O-acetylesterase [Stieleria sp.]|uniref:sialate O-acetylesterase n=1 Tax=Stieleria sp. TaxID=2795976 RepID=UPI0035679E97